MSAQHGSSKSNVAYAINQREFASMMLVTACAIAASFIVTYSLTSTFGYEHLVSMTTSFITSIAVGLISIAVHPVGSRTSRHR